MSAPILMWQYGGCVAGPSCQTGWYSSPAVADLDGDGKPDVIWGAYDVVALDGATGSLKWRAASPRRVWPGVAVADLTGDGTLEVIVGRDADQLRVYDRFGNTVWTRNPFGGSGEIRTLAVADLEHDGQLEILAGSAGSSSFQLNAYEPNGTVRPGWPVRHAGDPGSGSGLWNQNVVVADMKGDGFKEIITTTGSHYITGVDRNGNQLPVNAMYAPAQFWSQVGTAVDLAAEVRGWQICGVENRANLSDAAPAVADLDGDGIPEFVVAGNVYNCGTTPYTDLYHIPFIFNLDRSRWMGGGFNWSVLPTPVAGSAPRSEDHTVIENVQPNTVVADLDGDGFKEILYSSYDGRVHAYWLDKTEHGSWPYRIPTSGAPGDDFRFASEPIVADLDNDGHAEVIFTSWPKKATGRVGQLHILDYLGHELYRVDLPAPANGATWNGGLAAPTIANIDADANFELVIGTVSSGVVAYKLPNTSSARVLWGTGRANFTRTGVAAPQGPPPDTTPPAVAVTAPADGATVTGPTTIGATATDYVGVAGVQFRVDGINVGAEDLDAPYSVSWDTTTASNGSHALTAVARDAAGNTATSATVTVTVFNDRTPPAVAVTAPANGATVSGTTTIGAAASDNVGVAGVQFRVDGTNVGAEVLAAPYSVSWDTTTASNGSHALTAVARDAAGNTATSATVNVTVFNDTTPPSVAVTAPASGATVSGTTTIGATATDNVGVTGVQFRVDGINVGAEVLAAPYSVSWDTTTASNGSHALTAVARDAAGNTATSATVSITVFNDRTPPTVAVTAPADGATASGTTTIGATASDNVGVAGVQFRVDGINVGAEVLAAPYSVSWDTTTASNGSHALTAVARDAAGNTATAAAVTVTVDNNTASTIRIEETTTAVEYYNVWTQNYSGSPGGWSGGSVAFSVQATARATLTFNGTGVSWIGWRGPQQGIANVYLDDVAVGRVDAYDAATTVQAVLYSSPQLAAGPHSLAIEVTRTKNAASSDFFVSVDAFDVFGAPPDTTPPTAAVSTPESGATVNGTTTIRVDASDNVEVVGVQFFVDGTPLGAEDTAVPYAVNWNTTTVADGEHTLTAVARDGAGNTTTSAPATVIVSNAAPSAAATRFEDTDPSIVYTSGTLGPGQPPDWFHGSRSRSWSSGTATFNRSAGATATFTFTGTSVSWIGFRAAWAGIARVYVDGTLATELDLYSTTELVQTPVFSAVDLAPGTHTLTVESTGQKNPDASDYAVVVDAFDVAPGSPPTVAGTRMEETSAAFTSGWTQGDATNAWSGGTAAVSATPASPGARATFTFTGTSASWIGSRGPKNGIARVYVDGAFQATVDLYAPAAFQAAVYTVTMLAQATHTLAIEVTGQKNAAATDSLIYVDGIDVLSRIEDGDPAIAYTGSWVVDTSRNWSGTSLETGAGTAMRSATAGSRAEFAFSGTSVTWLAFRGPWIGMADVSVDGGPATRLDLYSATESVQAPVFSVAGLDPGNHTLRIDIPGVKNAASAAAWVMVDAFDVVPVQPAPGVTRRQESDPSVTFTSDWTQAGVSNLWSGEQARQSAIAGGRATFTFTGTAVRWIGERGFGTGLANVSIDGQLIALVDTSTAVQEGYQAVLFSTTGLAPGSHTLTIDVVGRHNEPPGATVERVVVDAFDVY